ncbi:hypothetical protein MELA_03036 [Candidatus Methylomirabilis lanthanidiphila]|uniref:Uncharacterized protein n=1 Tax=Candidatus Methylomirabilis lanthanidiphila TaxID=2211376 RepID=A0A564ZMU2_9BACT|nr:hypothetical protein MELA_03036 [Candidatus Methylomirabilis lanthanidiphila]
MNRTPWIWMRIVAFILGVLGVSTGVALADPSGAANIRQFPVIAAFPSIEAPLPQRTFLTSDTIVARTAYYDPADACAGIDPVSVKFFVFNLEGQLVLGRNRDAEDPALRDVDNLSDEISLKYQTITALLNPGALPIGSYNVVFRVEACPSGDPAVVVSDFYTIEVVGP